MKFVRLNRIRNYNYTFRDSDRLWDSLSGGLIFRGRRHAADRILRRVLVLLKRQWHAAVPVVEITSILSILRPTVVLRLRKVAGITYRIPSPVSDRRSARIAVRWFLGSLTERREKDLSFRLMAELADLRSGRGVSRQRREALERTALDNRVHIRYLKR